MQCNAMDHNKESAWKMIYLHFLAHYLLVGPVILMQYFQTKLLLPAQHKGVLIYLWQHNEHWHCMQWQIKTDMQICGTGGNNQCYHFRSCWYTRNHHAVRMGDMDYNPNPTFNNVEAAHENNNDDNDNVDDKRRALPLRIPQSRGSDSPSVQTPMVSFKYLLFIT